MIDAEDNDITRIVKLLHWVRRQENDDQCYGRLGERLRREMDDTEDPETYLQEQHRGIRSACRRFAYILTGTLLSQGLMARVVSLSWSFDRHTSLRHNVVEVWVLSLGKWIVIDPTIDAFVLVDGKPASALEIHDAAEPDSASKISFDLHGGKLRRPPPPVNQYRKFFKHIFVSRTNALFDGYRYAFFARKKITFAHYSGPGLPSFPETKKRIMLCNILLSTLVILVLSGQMLWRYLSLPQVLAASTQDLKSVQNDYRPELGILPCNTPGAHLPA